MQPFIVWTSYIGRSSGRDRDLVQYTMPQPPLYGSYQEFAIVLWRCHLLLALFLFDKTQSLLPKFDRKKP